jgi:hypothetical protein
VPTYDEVGVKIAKPGFSESSSYDPTPEITTFLPLFVTTQFSETVQERVTVDRSNVAPEIDEVSPSIKSTV